MGGGASVKGELDGYERPKVGGEAWEIFIGSKQKEQIEHKGKKLFNWKHAFWRFEHKDTVYMITLFHELIFGAQKVVANGVVIHQIRFKFKLTGVIEFNLAGVKCKIESRVVKSKTKEGHGHWSYELYANQNFVERLERLRTFHVWRTNALNINVREIQFDSDSMNIFMDRKLVKDPESEFAEVGSVFRWVTENAHSFELRVLPERDKDSNVVTSAFLTVNGEKVNKMPPLDELTIAEIRKGCMNVNEECGTSSLLRNPGWRGGSTEVGINASSKNGDDKLVLSDFERAMLAKHGGYIDEDGDDPHREDMDSPRSLECLPAGDRTPGMRDIQKKIASKTTDSSPLVLTEAEKRMFEEDGAKVPTGETDTSYDGLTAFEKRSIERSIEEDNKKNRGMALARFLGDAEKTDFEDEKKTITAYLSTTTGPTKEALQLSAHEKELLEKMGGTYTEGDDDGGSESRTGIPDGDAELRSMVV